MLVVLVGGILGLSGWRPGVAIVGLLGVLADTLDRF
jgi:hypothetical protein